MSLSSFFNKLKYGSYKNSSRPSVYEKIAQSYDMSPQHVYEIAHGKRPQSSVDKDILNELLSKGIVVNKFF